MAKKKSGSTGTGRGRPLAVLERMVAEARALSAEPPAKSPSKTAPQFVLRYTPELRDKIARLAKANGRSINSELIALLERALSHGDAVEELQTWTGDLFDRVEKLENLVREHDARLSGRDPYNVEK